jgi:hypothetical protein
MASTRRSTRLLRSVGLVLAVTLSGVPAPAYVGPQATQPLHRRDVAAALGASLMLPGLPAMAGDRDRASMLFGVRRQSMPKILKWYKQLKADGKITEEFLATGLKPMWKSLQSYGSINRLGEAPDKISRKLLKDADEFKVAAKGGDYAAAMAMLETYRNDIPAGVGEFTWDSTLSSDVGAA